MTNPNPPANTHFPVLTRVLFLVACILFVVSALLTGKVIGHHTDGIPYFIGAFAAIALGWAVA